MLRTDLIDAINQRHVWAFLGSGVSADAGLPPWRELLDDVTAQLPGDTSATIAADRSYLTARTTGVYPACFERIEKASGRQLLEAAVASRLSRVTAPGPIGTLLCDLPFQSLITTNYDPLIEIGLRSLGEHGWSAVGNTDSEVRLVSGNAERVVWHIHGSVALPNDKSKLVLTTSDYDNIYLDDGPVVTQLRSVLLRHRIVFAGFSFNDPEVDRLLKRVGRLANPARPIYAFLGFSPGDDIAATCTDYRTRHNVDIIPYLIAGTSHAALKEILDAYSSMILRRTLRFNQPSRPCPSFDPETTSLLIYNTLHGSRGAGAAPTPMLIRARVMAVLSRGDQLSADHIASQLDCSSAPSRQLLDSVLMALVDEHLVEGISADGTTHLSLTDSGRTSLQDKSSQAELLLRQFLDSLRSRVASRANISSASVQRVTQAAQAFLTTCIEKRSLGVAALNATRRPDYQSFHMVALLQALPEHAQTLSGPDEAVHLIGVVRGVLGHPTDAERKYIGTAVQARFALHLLKLDPTSLETRLKEMTATCFLLDSSTLIPLAARSCRANAAATGLAQKILSLGAHLVTTPLLAEEVAEHARFAEKVVPSRGNSVREELLQAAQGRLSTKNNEFIDGLLAEIGRGDRGYDLQRYLDEVLGPAHAARRLTGDHISHTLRSLRVEVIGLDQWKGFAQEMWADRDAAQGDIEAKRRANHTFRHDRQVKAEAEALVIVRGIRATKLSSSTASPTYAYFVSQTRVVDEVEGGATPITMRPEFVLQWINTLTACDPSELALITDSLFAELAEKNLAIVDAATLTTVFSPLVAASKEQLEAEISKHRQILAHRYGEDGVNSFSDVADHEVPIVLSSIRAQEVDDLKDEVKHERELRRKAEQSATLDRKDKEELAKLRYEKKERNRRARRIQQGHGKKTKKKKRK
jgi:hypothetical protein